MDSAGNHTGNHLVDDGSKDNTHINQQIGTIRYVDTWPSYSPETSDIKLF